jgi:hypothetical protein
MHAPPAARGRAAAAAAGYVLRRRFGRPGAGGGMGVVAVRARPGGGGACCSGGGEEAEQRDDDGGRSSSGKRRRAGAGGGAAAGGGERAGAAEAASRRDGGAGADPGDVGPGAAAQGLGRLRRLRPPARRHRGAAHRPRRARRRVRRRAPPAGRLARLRWAPATGAQRLLVSAAHVIGYDGYDYERLSEPARRMQLRVCLSTTLLFISILHCVVVVVRSRTMDLVDDVMMIHTTIGVIINTTHASLVLVVVINVVDHHFKHACLNNLVYYFFS